MTCARCGSEGFGCYECTPDPFAIIARLTADRDAWAAESADNLRKLVEATARIDAMRDDIITLGAQVNSLMRERDAALAQVAEAATLPAHYGAARIQTVQRDFKALRTAIRAHNTFGTEAAWERFERWTGLWPNDASDTFARLLRQARAEGMRKAACVPHSEQFGTDWLGMSAAILAAAKQEDE